MLLIFTFGGELQIITLEVWEPPLVSQDHNYDLAISEPMLSILIFRDETEVEGGKIPTFYS